MTQDRYVTSKAIQGIRTEIGEDVLPKVTELRRMVDSTNLDGLGWGLVGELAVGIRYRDVQKDVREKFMQAVDVLESWQETLDNARINWRRAEDSSTVVYT
ncbi:hypothetical protein [Streptosporangium sp. NPDC003464]